MERAIIRKEIGERPQNTERKIVVMNNVHIPTNILRNLPYADRIPMDDFDDLDLVCEFNDMFGFSGSNGVHNHISTNEYLN